MKPTPMYTCDQTNHNVSNEARLGYKISYTLEIYYGKYQEKLHAHAINDISDRCQ